MDFGVIDWHNEYASIYTSYKTVLTIAACAYLPVIFGMKRAMRDLEAFKLTWFLRLWNLLLAAFSLIGACYLFPSLLHHVSDRHSGNIVDAVCDYRVYTMKVAPWVFYFNVSKVFEFMDTFLIVLRKKPLIFLHWFHHIVTMLYCWYENQVQYFYNGSGFWFATLNLIVHALMYTYYFLASCGYKPPKGCSKILTSLQSAQMLVGIGVLWCTTQCANWQGHLFGITFGAVMYFVYFVLFFKLYLDRYVWGRKKATISKTQANGYNNRIKKE